MREDVKRICGWRVASSMSVNAYSSTFLTSFSLIHLSLLAIPDASRAEVARAKMRISGRTSRSKPEDEAASNDNIVKPAP